MSDVIAVSLVWGLFLWLSLKEITKLKSKLANYEKLQARQFRYQKWLEIHLEHASPEILEYAKQDAEKEWEEAHRQKDGVYDYTSNEIPRFEDIRYLYKLATMRRVPKS